MQHGETRAVEIRLPRERWQWVDEDMAKRNVTLDRYLSEVLELFIVEQIHGRGDDRRQKPQKPGVRLLGHGHES